MTFITEIWVLLFSTGMHFTFFIFFIFYFLLLQLRCAKLRFENCSANNFSPTRSNELLHVRKAEERRPSKGKGFRDFNNAQLVIKIIGLFPQQTELSTAARLLNGKNQDTPSHLMKTRTFNASLSISIFILLFFLNLAFECYIPPMVEQWAREAFKTSRMKCLTFELTIFYISVLLCVYFWRRKYCTCFYFSLLEFAFSTKFTCSSFLSLLPRQRVWSSALSALSVLTGLI